MLCLKYLRDSFCLMKTLLKTYAPGFILFVISLVIGLMLYKDYGVAWDDPVQRELGLVSYNYAFHKDQTLKTITDKDYGVAFELVLIGIERALDLSDTREIYLSRHLAIHVFFLLSAFMAYILFYRLFRSNIIACLGFLALVFHPRIYAHSFFNSKDVPFLSAILIAIVFAHFAFTERRLLLFFLLGLCTGYATAIRIMGVMLILIFSFFLLIDFISAVRKRKEVLHVFLRIVLFLLGTTLMLYASWPILWEHPVDELVNSFKSFSHYAWNGQVLFNGVTAPADQLPRWYAPFWFAISTPVLWLVLGATGIVLLVYHFVKFPGKFFLNTYERNFTICLLCFAGPVLAVLILRSKLYDDWRHLYFIYPSFVLIILYAISHLAAKPTAKWLLSVACAAQLVYLGYFVVRYHPLQQVYFNKLVSHKEDYLRSQYEMEYWGSSYKQGLEYILEHDKSDSIRVFWSLHPVINNVGILKPEQRKRLVLVGRGEYPFYFVTNYRQKDPLEGHHYPVVYKLEVLNNIVLGVYKIDGPKD